MKKAWLLLCVTALLCWTGCGLVHVIKAPSRGDMNKVRLGMSQNEVRSLLGDPVEVSADMMEGVETHGDTYYAYTGTFKTAWIISGPFTIFLTWCVPPDPRSSPYGERYLYFVYYRDDKVVRWGHPRDWRPDFVQELRMR